MHIILFKIKAWLDLSERRENGEHIDSKNIKKHKNDIMRILLKNVMDCTIFRIHSDSLQLFQRKRCHICQRKHTCPFHGANGQQSLIKARYYMQSQTENM